MKYILCTPFSRSSVSIKWRHLLVNILLNVYNGSYIVAQCLTFATKMEVIFKMIKFTKICFKVFLDCGCKEIFEHCTKLHYHCYSSKNRQIICLNHRQEIELIHCWSVS